MDIFARVTEMMQRSAVDRFGALLGGYERPLLQEPLHGPK
ncbi:hypothetical protein GJR88_01701 [Dietzia sp. DQ12-45-1b]|nr:hypothetical protein GJR88_01701 [Dietzia sp. DQ12-45-1b]